MSKASSIVVPNALCIPRMDIFITKQQIFQVFCKLKIGTIESVVEIPFKDMPRYKRVIVKLKWNESERAKYMLNRFQRDENVKIVYHSKSPWYWICVPNRLHCRLEDSRNNSFVDLPIAEGLPTERVSFQATMYPPIAPPLG
jgi:hypothetical protein